MAKKILFLTAAIIIIAYSLAAQVTGTILDSRDGYTYKTVVIGTQTWMAENLKSIKYNDGTSIPLIEDDSIWIKKTTPAYCWSNNDYKPPIVLYGALYNWYAVSTSKLCPSGWHVPSDREWTVLTTFLGGESIAGGKLKETGTTHWKTPNTDATNETGFTALPGGGRSKGNLTSIGESAIWWSTTEGSPTKAYGLIIHQGLGLRRYGGEKTDGFSVRCIKD